MNNFRGTQRKANVYLLNIPKHESNSSNIHKTQWKHHIFYSYCLTFRRLGRAGNPLRDVRPTFIRLNTSKFSNSSVSPTMEVLLQLSKFSSVICKNKVITVINVSVFSSSQVSPYYLHIFSRLTIQNKRKRMPLRVSSVTVNQGTNCLEPQVQQNWFNT